MDDELGYRPQRRSTLLSDILPILLCAALGAGLGAVASSEARDFSETQQQIGVVVNRDFLSAESLGTDRPNLDGVRPAAAPADAQAAEGSAAPVFSAALVSARAGLAQGDVQEALSELRPGTRRAVLDSISRLAPSASVAQ